MANPITQAASILLAAASVYVTLLNWVMPLWAMRKKRHYSLVPFFGGLCGALALCLWSAGRFSQWWWVPLVLDLGSAPLLAGAALYLIYRRLTGKPL